MINNLNKWQNIYNERIKLSGYKADNEQLAIIEQFARIEHELLVLTIEHSKKYPIFLTYFINRLNVKQSTIKGLYLFGSVGRGKTFLMDMFCEKISFPVKRLHFHHFMQEVHNKLQKIKGKDNPLNLIAKEFAKKYRILCLDEFMVTDITDAMLLYGLLRNLVDNKVIIITTTNISPDDLYKNGLQRERFLPAIDLIKKNCIVHKIAEGQDFRRICLKQHKRFFSPLNLATKQELQKITAELSKNLYLERDGVIVINQRKIPFIEKSQEVIWFSFKNICESNRSQIDYIELAKQFHVIVISDIPVLDEFKEDAARRFLLLIDELYDQRIDLILSSIVPIKEIYTGHKNIFEFKRVQSRLFEMQSVNYGF